jgi:antitoxin YefM
MIGITATDARKTFFDLIRGAKEKRVISRVRHRSGNVVILSEMGYDPLLETMDLLAAPGFRAGFSQAEEEGDTVCFEEGFGEGQ